jgi:hypothetical protein
MPNLRQHGAHAFPNQGVALARHLFEALAVKHNDAPPPILNQTRPFELACYQRYGGSIHPEHLRQEFLCQGQHVTFDSILRLKQPSGEAALHRMEGIARRRLLNLCQESFVVTRHQIPEGFAALNGCVKVQTGATTGACTTARVKPRRMPNPHMAPTTPSSPTVAISMPRPSDITAKRETKRKIDKLDGGFRLLQNRPHFQGHFVEVGNQKRMIYRRERREQTVLCARPGLVRCHSHSPCPTGGPMTAGDGKAGAPISASTETVRLI